MYTSSSGYHTSGRPSRQRSRTRSDPGHSHISSPYTLQWPAPARRNTEPVPLGISGLSGILQRIPSQSSSVEQTDTLVVLHPESSPAQDQTSSSPAGAVPLVASKPLPARPSSPQSSGHQRSSSKQGSIRISQDSLIKDIPQPSNPVLNTTAFLVPRQQNVTLTPPQGTAMAHQELYQNMHQQSYWNASATQVTHHTSYSGSEASPQGGHHSNNSHHSTRHRSRSRRPSAASHRYASSITQPAYNQSSSTTLNVSRTSFNTSATLPKNHNVASQPPGETAGFDRAGSNPTNILSGSQERSRPHTRPSISSGSQERSRSHTRPNITPSTTAATTATAHSISKSKEIHVSAPAPTPAAKDIHHTTQRPALPANLSSQTQTRYVNMLLALDDIPPLFNLLASFFTWILLAGFVLFPGTFASWRNQPAGDTEKQILSIVDDIPLYVIAWVCTAIGAIGMIWLWWRWQNNYIWITNRIFVPGFLNSITGIISTLTSVYGAQAGVFGATAKSTIIVTGVIAVICGLLVIIYQFWLLRTVKKEHDHQIGKERAGMHGEGIVGEKKTSKNEV
ncbi:uncharacterized protein FIBRA_04211 [Fibroporia radiculosa]|uniref:Uncharacterized protein n=1 Tax=Fibroporia radiculosa TaxID=599839 RepID=J4H2U5_9APHY|nr:uncharacterized protein FIBRA_04211 [Fibroporia radiculosa]CCM02134.1 predicted protein [Fibroporia radiculosa]